MPRYRVGIDLGTTHTVVAYHDADAGDAIRLLEIEQLIAPGEVAARALLPSLRYHPAEGELAAGERQLPWPDVDASISAVAGAVVGSLARRLGAQVPGRLVASAKSWLSHSGVDRGAPILPWGADASVARVSPIAASAGYLAHVRAAWDARFAAHPLAEQQLVLTVPASFDEAARALTVEAARRAGLDRLQLLEEPQAAFYDWLHRHRDTLADELAESRLVLVCDVGGGTTDFSLIRIDPADEGPRLTRVAVGNHLMLGGDNMDLALAHRVESRLAAGGDGGPRLSAGQLSQLIERCRAAKEELLAADAPDAATITLLGAGSRLVGATRTAALGREEVERSIVDGFFPRVAIDEPLLRGRAAIVEFGLPYASDPAVTRHLAAFLRQHAAVAREAIGGRDGAPAIPDTLLLNGGVFRGDALARRLQQTLEDWRGGPLRLLPNADPDFAVARGAVAYALSARSRAPRIGGGSARSYFLVLGTPGAKAAAPAGEAARAAICVLPRGSEAGRERRLAERSFALRLGEPVRFHLVSSTAEPPGEAPPQIGQLVDLDRGDYRALPPIATVVAAGEGRRDARVELATRLTEVGTLEMHCVSSADPARRWLLEFELRSGDGEAASAAVAAATPRLGDAIERIERVYGSRSREVAPKEVRQLRSQLEQLLGSRERWPTALLRQLFDALWRGARGRRRSADHERVWLNLAGWCLRPGFGAPLDDWRIDQLWTLFEHGVQYAGDAQVSAEWWTLWRRAAGGLGEAAQKRLLDDFAYNVQGRAAGIERPARLVKGGEDDMVRLAAALERIPAEHKVEIGDWLLDRVARADRRAADGVRASADAGRLLWALGRLGARRPFYASAHHVVAAESAARWIDALLGLDWKRIDAAGFAAAHIARLTGDRSRDLPAELRERVAGRLQAARAAPHWAAMVREVVELDEAGERQVYGEALPPGLKLIG